MRPPHVPLVLAITQVCCCCTIRPGTIPIDTAGNLVHAHGGGVYSENGMYVCSTPHHPCFVTVSRSPRSSIQISISCTYTMTLSLCVLFAFLRLQCKLASAERVLSCYVCCLLSRYYMFNARKDTNDLANADDPPSTLMWWPNLHCGVRRRMFFFAQGICV